MDSGTNTAFVIIRQEGLKIAKPLKDALGGIIYAREGIKDNGVVEFSKLKELFRTLFSSKKNIIAIMATGIAVRMISGLPKSKYRDPAVVVVDEGGRFAISLLSGHEGGANRLSLKISSVIGCQPVITTATESLKRYVVGIGFRKHTTKEQLKEAILKALDIAGIMLNDVRLISTCWHKANSKSLLDASLELGLQVRFLPKFLYENELYRFERSLAEKYIGIKNVAEASALIASFNPTLILKKTVFDGVTIAIAREGMFGL
ncbi:cobalamin (vitamin B12) biosynthesis CbiG protein [Hippea maritima DSM 10411]|uniref:Cobalamin (Vitamin B12) biosynthesis CbiG protein n=2 Tax=Hippea TaxID=84404 RepID=F2LU86_HIPMA|nr:cobalamin (vitamin B12) biosynthesis CbiG protein [Hippea maritima DSM 10411]